jgi:uncharacterized membrane protein YcaP (DUF421 family)
MFDFVVLFLLSNVVQNAIIGNDSSLLWGFIGAATLVAVNAALNRWLAVSERAARVLEGKPTTIIENAASSPTRPGGCHCGLSTWSTPSGCRTATT